MFNYAVVLSKTKNFKEAIKYYQNLIEVSQLNKEIFLSFGRTLFKTKQYKKAIECFQRAFQLKPNDQDALQSLGLTYEKA